MPIVYGLTDAGFVVKPLTVIRDELNAAFRAAFGNSLSLNDRSVFGIIVGILAERFALLWELLEAIHSSQDPDKAAGAFLEALCTLTGTFRPGDQPSTVILTLTGDPASDIPATSQARTASTGKVFATAADATLVGVPVWVSGSTYSLGSRVFNPPAGDPSVYQCIQGGTAGATGPLGTAPDTTLDGTCLWTFLGPGTAAVDVDAASQDVGPIVGAARDITQIVNETLGWRGVVNLSEAELGRVVAADPELRVLREEELAGAGTAPFDALLALLLKLAGSPSVTLFVNNTDTTDPDGLPPHSLEALVRGGADQDIINALFRGVAAGIGTRGNQTGTAVDSQGVSHPVSFSRVVEIPIFVAMSVATGAKYPPDGDKQIQDALVAFGAAQEAGRDAVTRAFEAQAFRVPGVLDVNETVIFTDAIGTATAWAPTTHYTSTPGARSVVTNGGRKYICIATGTSAASGGPIGTGTDIADGSIHWRFLGANISIGSRELATVAPANVAILASNGTP